MGIVTRRAIDSLLEGADRCVGYLVALNARIDTMFPRADRYSGLRGAPPAREIYRCFEPLNDGAETKGIIRDNLVFKLPECGELER